MSSKELGKACFVSTATVYRLCDKLNLAGFSDLKIKITSSLNDYLKSNGDFNFDFPVNPYQTHYEIVHKIDEYHQRLTAASSNQEHLAIVITFGGRGILSDILPRILTKTKIPIVLISFYDYTFKEVEVDYQLYISPYENHYKKISSFSTRLSLLYILDVLYTCYFEVDYQENIDKKLMYYHNIVEGSIK